MTTDHELHDLLTEVADGPTPSAAGWDDIVRRGSHHRRATRLRNGIALGGLAAVVSVGGLAIGDRLDRDPGVVANDPTPTTPTPPTTPTTFHYETTLIPPDDLSRMTAARVQGVFVTVLTAPADPVTGFDPCTARHPRVVESADGVGIELVDESVERGLPWAACQSSPFSGWGTIELTDPLGDRTLTDLSTGQAMSLIDGAPLLFPTAVPEPFDLGRWDEFHGAGGAGPEWTFSFSADDLNLSVSTSYRDYTDCGNEPIEVRGATGYVCQSESHGFVLGWQEGGYHRRIGLGPVSDNITPFTVDDVLAIAESLEPLGGTP
jgi:hypothetical protein